MSWNLAINTALWYDLAVKNNIDIVTSDYYNVFDNKETHCGHYDISSNRIINKEEIDNIIKNVNRSRLLWFSVKGIYKSEIIKKNKIFYPELKLGEETVFLLQCFLSSSTMYYIGKPFYYYIQTPNSLTRIKYKENLLHQLEDLYLAKKDVYKKYNFDMYHDDLNTYTMQHSIPMIISNELTHKLNLFKKIKTYRTIRNSEMIKAAYKNCSVNLINSKLKYMALLLKFKLYFLLAIITV